MVDEYWDLYDKERNKLNRVIKRGDPFRDGEFYICCEICVKCGLDKYLITKRHPAKVRGGLWEFTAGGVLVGETTAMGAVREVREELGIKIKTDELKLMMTYTKKNYFMDVFMLEKDIKFSDLNLQETEVTEAAYADKQQICAMESKGEFVHSTWERFKLYENI